MPLQVIEPDQLWTAEMPLRLAGCDIGARMTLVRLPDGSLWVHSPIALSEPLKRDLDALGPVRHVVSPSSWHYQHAAEFARAYPKAMICAAPGAAKRLKSLGVDRTLSDDAEPAWAGVLDQALFRGSRLYDEIDFYHPATRTLILTDLCFNYPADSSWMMRLMLGPLGIVGRFSPSASFRWTIAYLSRSAPEPFGPSSRTLIACRSDCRLLLDTAAHGGAPGPAFREGRTS